MSEGMAASVRWHSNKRINPYILCRSLHKFTNCFLCQSSSIFTQKIITFDFFKLKINISDSVVFHHPFWDYRILRNYSLLSPLAKDIEIAISDLFRFQVYYLANSETCVKHHHQHQTISNAQIIFSIEVFQHSHNFVIRKCVNKNLWLFYILHSFWDEFRCVPFSVGIPTHTLHCFQKVIDVWWLVFLFLEHCYKLLDMNWLQFL